MNQAFFNFDFCSLGFNYAFLDFGVLILASYFGSFRQSDLAHLQKRQSYLAHLFDLPI